MGERVMLEMNLQKAHIRMIVRLPSKISLSQFTGIIKGKTAINVFKSFPVLKKKPYWGNHLWSRGYCSSTIGLDEAKIKKYVKYQHELEKQEDQQQFGIDFYICSPPVGLSKSTFLEGGLFNFLFRVLPLS